MVLPSGVITACGWPNSQDEAAATGRSGPRVVPTGAIRLSVRKFLERRPWISTHAAARPPGDADVGGGEASRRAANTAAPATTGAASCTAMRARGDLGQILAIRSFTPIR